MLVVGNGQSPIVISRVDEVGNEECSAPLFQRVGHIAQCKGYIRACMFGRKIKQFAYKKQYMPAPLFRRDELLDMVGKENHADFVIVLNGGKGERGRNLRNHQSLLLAHCAEITAAGHIDKQHHRHLALLFVDLDIGPVVARGHVPVYVAYVIAILVLAHLAEGHAAALECRMVFTGKYILRQTFGLYLNLTYLLE